MDEDWGGLLGIREPGIQQTLLFLQVGQTLLHRRLIEAVLNRAHDAVDLALYGGHRGGGPDSLPAETWFPKSRDR